jgi:AcrR family transcriptional regulator
MVKSQPTAAARERIVQAAERIILARGYASATVDEI